MVTMRTGGGTSGIPRLQTADHALPQAVAKEDGVGSTSLAARSAKVKALLLIDNSTLLNAKIGM